MSTKKGEAADTPTLEVSDIQVTILRPRPSNHYIKFNVRG